MSQDISTKWNKIIAKAWADEDYKARLLASPKEVLKEEGVEIPQDMELEILESTPKKAYLVLPTVPTDETNLEEGDIRKAALMTL